MSKYVKKLGSDKSYQRPKTTYQEKLSAEEIESKLEGYQKVENIAEVPLNTHIRYFTINPDGTQVFRTGGFLHNKQNADTYIMLSNGKNSWSVQVNNSIFFRKLSQKDEIDAIHASYKQKLEEKDRTIEKLKRYIKLKIKNSTSTQNSNLNQNPNQNSNSKQNPNYTQNPKSQSKSLNHPISNHVSNKSISKNTGVLPTKYNNGGSKTSVVPSRSNSQQLRSNSQQLRSNLQQSKPSRQTSNSQKKVQQIKKSSQTNQSKQKPSQTNQSKQKPSQTNQSKQKPSQTNQSKQKTNSQKKVQPEKNR